MYFLLCRFQEIKYDILVLNTEMYSRICVRFIVPLQNIINTTTFKYFYLKNKSFLNACVIHLVDFHPQASDNNKKAITIKRYLIYRNEKTEHLQKTVQQ